MGRRRTYPERLIPSQLSISFGYMDREGARWGVSVRDWALSYLMRNSIPFSIDENEGEEMLLVHFPSVWRQKFFVLNGNRNFPYFEFL